MLTHVNSMHCNIKYNCKYASFSVYNLRIPVPAMIFYKAGLFRFHAIKLSFGGVV